jgi:hypothetical protein
MINKIHNKFLIKGEEIFIQNEAGIYKGGSCLESVYKAICTKTGAMKKALGSPSDAFQMTTLVLHGGDLERHSIKFRGKLPQFARPIFARVYDSACHLP